MRRRRLEAQPAASDAETLRQLKRAISVLKAKIKKDRKKALAARRKAAEAEQDLLWAKDDQRKSVRKQRSGIVFALATNGVSVAEIARIVGVSASTARKNLMRVQRLTHCDCDIELPPGVLPRPTIARDW